MLAKDMCSKNPEVGHLIRPIHNKSLFDSENFSSFAKFAFQNKRPDDNIRTTLILSKNIQPEKCPKHFLPVFHRMSQSAPTYRTGDES